MEKNADSQTARGEHLPEGSRITGWFFGGSTEELLRSKPGKQKRADSKAAKPEKTGARERRDLAQNTRRIRLQKGLSQSELAERAGLTQKWISKIELGRANPGINTIAALSGAVKVPVHELLTPRKK